MKKALFGYGGHAREVSSQMKCDVTFFVDDLYTNDFTLPISSFDPNEYEMMIAVADSTHRKNIQKRLPKETKYFTFIHPTSLILDNNIEIGEGSFIGAYSILTTNIKLGKHTILNRMNQIGHDTLVGDFFSAMPGSIVSGNVTIGDCVYLGTNSSIREKIKIPDNVTVGLNTGIVKDILTSGKYIGSKTQILR